jgi:hypothetical protein
MFVDRSRPILTVVNLLLVLAVFQQLHYLLLHQSGHSAPIYTLPSILIVLLAALGMAFVTGLAWLRPGWVALVMQFLLLAAGCGLLLALLIFPL